MDMHVWELVRACVPACDMPGDFSLLGGNSAPTTESDPMDNVRERRVVLPRPDVPCQHARVIWDLHLWGFVGHGTYKQIEHDLCTCVGGGGGHYIYMYIRRDMSRTASVWL